MPVVSITRLRVRSWRFYLVFVLQALRIARQAANAEGSLATLLLRDDHMTFWTATAWSSDATMKAFMHAAPHGPAMRSLLNWCDEAALVHWTQDDAALPSWQQAHQRLQEEGRRSKVNHPSAAHTAYQIAAPTTNVTRQVRHK